MPRELTYAQALSEGLCQSMERDPSIFVTGIAVDYPSGIFGSTTEAARRFGPKRVFDAPAMENALTGIAIGAAAMGKRPVVVHPRNDFMFLSFDNLINLAAKWRYMFHGRAGNLPMVVRAVIGKGWGQGATHSQSLQAPLAHFPGLTVVMPAFPTDAKGLTIAALQHHSPVVILEHRSLYTIKGDVSEAFEPVPLGQANVVRTGSDITIVGTSLMAYEAVHAAEELARHGIDAEVVDLRTIRPLDETTVLASVKKTGRLVVADTSWELCGVASEIAALAAEKAWRHLKAPVRRIALPNCPAPVSKSLEDAFYPKASTIARAALVVLGADPDRVGDLSREDTFKGPY
ncbi:MAG TPA: transketolase C-terminal domain-containing protein [Xanthobacteraceae bacterium]|nr:transketolase C-terminal domain-containing protein [Xanthobacteraceae bacterium]